jgi:hypothetical protein
MENYVTADTGLNSRTHAGGKCWQCGEEPRLIVRLTDPWHGRTIRVFECACGEQIWAADPDESARGVGEERVRD